MIGSYEAEELSSNNYSELDTAEEKWTEHLVLHPSILKSLQKHDANIDWGEKIADIYAAVSHSCLKQTLKLNVEAPYSCLKKTLKLNVEASYLTLKQTVELGEGAYVVTISGLPAHYFGFLQVIAHEKYHSHVRVECENEQ